jgi:molybdenum cofactor biosynthesis enzyme MoaA
MCDSTCKKCFPKAARSFVPTEEQVSRTNAILAAVRESPDLEEVRFDGGTLQKKMSVRVK